MVIMSQAHTEYENARNAHKTRNTAMQSVMRLSKIARLA